MKWECPSECWVTIELFFYFFYIVLTTISVSVNNHLLVIYLFENLFYDSLVLV